MANPKRLFAGGDYNGVVIDLFFLYLCLPIHLKEIV